MLKFRTEKLTNRVTRIYGFSSELMYLVEGDTRAVLLDTGSGIGSLKECISQLTNKPLTVLITHGHVDHAMGAAEFDEVYMSKKDHGVFLEHGAESFRHEALSIIKPSCSYTKDDIIPTSPVENFKDLKGGDIFDLGNVTVVVYDCPGHTSGMVVALIREERSVLLGDSCNYFTFMFDSYSTTITEYEKSLKKLSKELNGKFDTVYLSHRNGYGHKELIEEVISICEDIKAGNADDIPTIVMGVPALVAKDLDRDSRKGNIVYNKHKI